MVQRTGGVQKRGTRRTYGVPTGGEITGLLEKYTDKVASQRTEIRAKRGRKACHQKRRADPLLSEKLRAPT